MLLDFDIEIDLDRFIRGLHLHGWGAGCNSHETREEQDGFTHDGFSR